MFCYRRSQMQQAESLRAVESQLAGMNSTLDVSFAALRIRHAPRTPSSLEASARSIRRRATRRLRCPEDCTCCCHSASLRRMIPKALSGYIGQVHASKRLLDDLKVTRLECDVQTCRRDRKTSNSVTWYAPTWMPYFSWQVAMSRPSFHFSIRTPRIVPMSAPIWGAIWNGNVNELRQLLLAGEASVYDVNESNLTVLNVSRVTQQLDIVVELTLN